MKNIINEIISVRSRVAYKDVKAIYLAALCDVTIAVLLIAGVAFLLAF